MVKNVVNIFNAFQRKLVIKMPNRGFRLADCQVVGFDLDMTLCRYRNYAMIRLCYECLASFLVNEKNYPAHMLDDFRIWSKFSIKQPFLSTIFDPIFQQRGEIVFGKVSNCRLWRMEHQARGIKFCISVKKFVNSIIERGLSLSR